MQHNTTLTTLNKPWPPEIDWLDSYVNLSSFPLEVSEGLFLPYKLTKQSKYYSDPDTGCWMYFILDFELTHKHFLEFYANSNKTMVVCTPTVPMRPDVLGKWTKHDNPLVQCYNYELLIRSRSSYKSNWYDIWNSDVKFELSLTVAVAMLIILTGLTGSVI